MNRKLSYLYAVLAGLLPFVAILCASLFWRAFSGLAYGSMILMTAVIYLLVGGVAGIALSLKHREWRLLRLAFFADLAASSALVLAVFIYPLAMYAVGVGSLISFYAVAVVEAIYFLVWYVLFLCRVLREKPLSYRILTPAVASLSLALTVVALLTVPHLFEGKVRLPEEGKGTPSTDTWSPEDAYLLEDTFVLYKDPTRDFVVLNLADIQLTNADYNPLAGTAKRTFATIRRLIEAERPDLILVSGDTGCGYAFSTVQITEFLDSFDIPWAPVFGNHDHEIHDCDPAYAADVFLAAENCLFAKGPADMGMGNYIINVVERTAEGDRVVQSILMMDTHGEREYTVDGKTVTDYDHIWQTQIDWYRWAVAGVQAYGGSTAVKSTVVAHMPFPEYADAFEEDWDFEVSARPSNPETPEKGDWKEEDSFGVKLESVSAPPYDLGFFGVMVDMGSTENFLVGHDHKNSFSTVYRGIRLTYALKTGEGCYMTKDMSGGTYLRIATDGTVTVSHRYDSK